MPEDEALLEEQIANAKSDIDREAAMAMLAKIREERYK